MAGDSMVATIAERLVARHRDARLGAVRSPADHTPFPARGTPSSEMRSVSPASPSAARWRWLAVGVVALGLLAAAWTVAIGWWLPRFLQPRIEAQATAALG